VLEEDDVLLHALREVEPRAQILVEGEGKFAVQKRIAVLKLVSAS